MTDKFRETIGTDPVVHTTGLDIFVGLSKREFFAAMAMQGMISACTGDIDYPGTEQVGSRSVNYADALIDSLNESREEEESK